MDYPTNTVARATVRGVPNVLVLRRDCGEDGAYKDWAHTRTAGFTCSQDHEVADVEVLEVGNNPPILLTVAEVAERWRISKMTVYRLIDSGALEAVKLGVRNYRIPVQSVRAHEGSAK